MNTIESLKQAVDKYLTAARDNGLTATGSGPIRGPLNDAFAAIDAYTAARDKVLNDPHLSAEGRRDRLGKLDADTRKLAETHLGTARRRLDETRKHHETKARLPRVDGADLMAARHDVDRLVAGVKPGALAERLAFAARSNDALADLLLRDGYAERVVLPAAGAHAGDAALWADTKRKLIAERLGPDGVPHLRAIEAAHTAGKAVTIVEHVIASTLGPAPDAPPAMTPIIVMHGAGSGAETPA
jgi:hypothetical protein